MTRDILPGAKKQRGMDTARHIVRATIEHGGCTYNTHPRRGGNPAPVTHGVACANPEHAQHEKIVPLEEFNLAAVQLYLWEHVQILREDGVHLGTWVNDGKVYLDLTTVYRTQEEALQAARETNQLAVFNIFTKEEITVTD